MWSMLKVYSEYVNIKIKVQREYEIASNENNNQCYDKTKKSSAMWSSMFLFNFLCSNNFAFYVEHQTIFLLRWIIEQWYKVQHVSSCFVYVYVCLCVFAIIFEFNLQPCRNRNKRKKRRKKKLHIILHRKWTE